MILNELDSSKTAILNPSDFYKPIKDFPKTIFMIFSKTLIKSIVEIFEPETIITISNANMDFPVYKLNIYGHEIAFCQAAVGAPACASIFEEIIAMGAKNLLLCGNCGCLDSAMKDYSIILPTVAIRDEGTSYHYLPACDEIELNKNMVNSIENFLIKNKIHYHKGKTWTTDAIFRETKNKMEKRKQQGAITVEMECASMAAIAKFRGVNFGQILYAADNLANDEYEPRSLIQKELSPEKQKIISLVLDCAIEIDNNL